MSHMGAGSSVGMIEIVMEHRSGRVVWCQIKSNPHETGSRLAKWWHLNGSIVRIDQYSLGHKTALRASNVAKAFQKDFPELMGRRRPQLLFEDKHCGISVLALLGTFLYDIVCRVRSLKRDGFYKSNPAGF